MTNANSKAIETEIVATRQTFDGATVYLHADGAISFRTHFSRGGRLPIANMWRVWEDVCTYTADEIPALIRAARAGNWVPIRVRKSPDGEAILAGQIRRHVCVRNGVIMPVNPRF